jgi:hypothetical protein
VAKEVSGGAEARDGAAPENGEPPAFYGKTAGFCFLKNKKLDSLNWTVISVLWENCSFF